MKSVINFMILYTHRRNTLLAQNLRPSPSGTSMLFIYPVSPMNVIIRIESVQNNLETTAQGASPGQREAFPDKGESAQDHVPERSTCVIWNAARRPSYAMQRATTPYVLRTFRHASHSCWAKSQ